jgi:hypothetical protein
LDDWETGYEVAGWEGGAWILHAMYENEELPAGLTHDDVDRIERSATGSAGGQERDPRDIDSLAELAELGTLTGVPIGASASPGDGWERLRWTGWFSPLTGDFLKPAVFRAPLGEGRDV